MSRKINVRSRGHLPYRSGTYMNLLFARALFRLGRKMHAEHDDVAVTEFAKDACPVAEGDSVGNVVVDDLIPDPV